MERVNVVKEKTGVCAIPVICGPTASGKTSFSIDLACRYHGEICCCDSMQIYTHLDIGTAKPTSSEKALVPHHLIDLVEPDTPFNVATYLDYAYKSIEELMDRNTLPVFCGGTGQYVSALSKGISFDDAPIDEEVEKRLVEEYEEKGIEPLYERLKQLDPEAAERIHPNNTKRVIHTVALCSSLGKTTKEIHEKSLKNGPRYPFRLYCIDWPREVLYERINLRVDEMVKEGIVEEAKWLYDQHYPEQTTALQAIGYKEFFPYFEGRCTLDEAVALLKQHTRNYAKRQLTWFRHMDEITWIPGSELQNYTLDL